MSGISRCLIIGGILFGAVFANVDTASAVEYGSDYPREADVDGGYRPGTDHVGIAGNDYEVKNASTHVRVYFPKRYGGRGGVSIMGSDLCYTTNDIWDQMFQNNRWPRTLRMDATITDFTVHDRYRPGKLKTPSRQIGAVGPSCGAIHEEFTNLPFDSTTGYYYLDITAKPARIDGRLIEGFQNGFRIHGYLLHDPTTGNLIMQNNNIVNKYPDARIAPRGGVGLEGGTAITVQQRGYTSTTRYRNYNIRFGSDCKLNANSERRIQFFDFDYGNSRVQPPPNITVQLYEKIGVTGVEQPVPISGPSVSKQGDRYLVRGANGVAVSVNFTAKPDAKYRLKLYDVYYNNTIQYSLPFDGIYHDVTCKDDEPPSDWHTTGTTTVSQPASGYAYAGDEIRWQHTILKHGVGTGPDAGSYEVRQTVSPGGSSAVTDSLDDPTAVLNLSQSVSAGSVMVFNQGSRYTASNGDIGKRICRQITWIPSSKDDAGSRSSNLECIDIREQPLLRVTGNDTRVGSALQPLDNDSTAKIVGTLRSGTNKSASWGEYGVLAPGEVRAFPSGAEFHGPSGGSMAASSKLTFANTGAQMGNFLPVNANAGELGTLPGIKSYFDSPRPLPAGYTKKHAGDVTIGTYEPNTIVIANGTVTIANNIVNTTSSAAQAARDITQMVIIANDITIDNLVTQVDAWLITPNGTVRTCTNIPPLVISSCSSPLTVNGPTVAAKLSTLRTSERIADSPAGRKPNYAETLNLRGDAYMWVHNLSKANGTWKTKHITELAPRY